MSRDIAVVHAYWPAAVSDEDVYVADLPGDTVIEVLGWLAAYVVLAAVTDRIAVYIFIRTFAKNLRLEGWDVTFTRVGLVFRLHARRNREYDINVKAGWLPWRH